jgi:hypothetical protein
MWEDLERKAAVDFGAVQEAAGGRDIMQSQGAVNFIDRYIAEEGLSKGGKLLHYRDKFAQPMNAKEFQKHLSSIGRASESGSVSFDNEIVGAEGQRRIAKRLYAVLKEDIRLMSEDPGLEGEVSRRLNVASRNYFERMEAIRAQENTALAVALKKNAQAGSLPDITDQDLYDQAKIVRSMLSQGTTDTRVAEIMKDADRVAPDAANELRRALLKDLFAPQEAKAGTAEALSAELREGATAIDFARFAQRFYSQEGRVAAIMGKGSPTVRALGVLANRVRRIPMAAREMSKIPPTRTMAQMLLTNVGGGAAGKETGVGGGAALGAALVQPLKNAIGYIRSPKIAARVFQDPTAALMMIGLMDPPPGMAQTAIDRLAGRLAARVMMLVEDEDLAPVVEGAAVAPTMGIRPGLAPEDIRRELAP